MGKSPGKWLKNLLFRKKSKSKKAGKVEVSIGGEASPCLAVGSQVISHPLHVSISNIEEKGLAPSVTNNGIKMPSASENSAKLAVSEFETSNGREEKAAIRVQTVIRSHEELRALIRLQALIRGRLVRRQAIATLHCVYGIVKMQALVRGWKARASGFGFDVVNHLNHSGANMSWQKTSAPAFICKLLCSTPLALALQMQYAQGEPNSVWNWLERWTMSKFWRPNPKTNATEYERSKQNLKEGNLRMLSSCLCTKTVADQKRPQSELEKVKCNLRMLSSACAQVTSEAQKTNHSLGLVSSFKADVPERKVFDSAKAAKEVNLVPVAMINVQTDSKLDKVKTNVDTASEPAEAGHDIILDEDNFAKGLHAVQSNAQGKNNCLSSSDELGTTEEQSWNKTPKDSKNCSAFVRSEFLENSLLSTPVLPSYMAATESTKAKLRAQCSPRLSFDDTDKTGLARRHSLPSTLNGKFTSLSPRAHRLVQTSCKGGIRGDRSLTSSRDGNEKPNRVEWRR